MSSRLELQTLNFYRQDGLQIHGELLNNSFYFSPKGENGVQYAICACEDKVF